MQGCMALILTGRNQSKVVCRIAIYLDKFGIKTGDLHVLDLNIHLSPRNICTAPYCDT